MSNLLNAYASRKNENAARTPATGAHVDGYGAESVHYEPTRVAYAEQVRHTARLHNEVGEHFPDHSTEYNVRDGHEVGENWRVRELHGLLYTVTAIIPNKARGFVTLICERVNE